MATGTSQYTTTVDTTNYARICRIVVDVFRDILWQVLCCKILPANLPTELQKNKPKLANHLHVDILTKFCPNTPGTQSIPVPVAKDFDVTALYALLRNLCKSVLCPTKGWGNTPDPVDNGLGDDIERVRLLRNEVYGHCGTATINVAYFNRLCSDIKTFTGRFDAFFRGQGIQCDFANEIVNLLNCPMDEKLQKFYIKQMQEKIVLSDMMKNLGCNVEVVKNDVGSIKDGQLKLINDVEYLMKTVDRIDKNTGVDKTPKVLVCDERNQPVSEQTSTVTKEGVVDKGQTTAETTVISSVQVPEDSKGDSQEMVQGEDGIILVVKLYADLKKELSKENGLAIARVLFNKEDSKDELEEIENASVRRLRIDILLKIVVHKDAATVQSFLKELKSQFENMSKLLAQTSVTEEDRENFRIISDWARRKGKVRDRVQTGCKIDDSDVEFFQRHLYFQPQKVDRIADVLLSKFYLNFFDHSKVIQCKEVFKRIKVLFETIPSCPLDSESELQSVLESSLYEEWTQYRSANSKQSKENAGIWQSLLQRIQDASVRWVESICQSFHLNSPRGNVGSIVLKFLTGNDFNIQLLKPEAVQRKLRELLEKTYPEPHFIFKDPVHVTVFIKSPKNADKEEIHFYLETVKNMKEIKDCDSSIGRYERDYMVEEMDPNPLKQWIEQHQINKCTETHLDDTVSWNDISREEKMNILMDTLERLEDGYEMLERYCEENDKFVYNEVFQKARQLSSKEHPHTDQMTELAYEKGGGLQKLFSTWIDFSEDPKEEKVMSDGMQQLDLLPSEKQLSAEEETTLEVKMISDDMQQLDLLSSEKQLPEETISDFDMDLDDKDDLIHAVTVWLEASKRRILKERRLFSWVFMQIM